jgi:hypothetical protein
MASLYLGEATEVLGPSVKLTNIEQYDFNLEILLNGMILSILLCEFPPNFY